MKYSILFLGLFSLNCFPSEKQELIINNHSTYKFIAYYKQHNGHATHTVIKAAKSKLLPIKKPTEKIPQEVILSWNNHKKQQIILVSDTKDPITIAPALAFCINNQIGYRHQDQSYSSSSSSIESSSSLTESKSESENY